MRKPSELSYRDLQQIVESVQAFLYIDLDGDGREIWNPDKEWNGADVCEHVSCALSQHDLVPVDKQLRATEGHQYTLGSLDGPSFRKQRQLLLSLANRARDGETYEIDDVDQELLDGLVNLTDTIADQAHEEHGVDCLLEPDTLCDCQKPGYFCSGIPGILAHVENGRLDSTSKVERCDQCQRYPTDQAAHDRLVELGIA